MMAMKEAGWEFQYESKANCYRDIEMNTGVWDDCVIGLVSQYNK